MPPRIDPHCLPQPVKPAEVLPLNLIPPDAILRGYRFEGPNELQITYVDGDQVEVVTWSAVSRQEVETRDNPRVGNRSGESGFLCWPISVASAASRHAQSLVHAEHWSPGGSPRQGTFASARDAIERPTDWRSWLTGTAAPHHGWGQGLAAAQEQKRRSSG
jgi:hypothetical protein